MSASASTHSSAELFAGVYDRLFSGKDYASEARLARHLAKRFGWDGRGPLLEVGCGTGGHTLAMAKAGFMVTAVDVDPVMLGQAQDKAAAMEMENVRFVLGPVDEVDRDGFGFAFALFNVITYVEGTDALKALFGAVARRLRPGGPFVFDGWNGLAALRDPPGSKRMTVEDREGRVICRVTAENDLPRQRTTLTYELSVLAPDGRCIGTGRHSIIQTLWLPEQIQMAAGAAGFDVAFCGPLNGEDRPATDEDWKILYVLSRR